MNSDPSPPEWIPIGGPRRFTLLDGMVLIAATAMAAAWIRAFHLSNTFLATRVGGENLHIAYIKKYGYLSTPILTTWTLALLALRALRPRPHPGRLAESLGFSSCCAAALAMVVVAATALGAHAGISTSSVGSSIYFLTIRIIFYAGMTVAGAWLQLALLGLWRLPARRDWIEDLGILLGACWLVLFTVTMG